MINYQKIIYWFCFKRQLVELYHYLLAENYISCGKDEFTSHFTGKKFIKEKRCNNKMTWNKDSESLILILVHLNEKKFISASEENLSAVLREHFKDVPNVKPEEFRKYKRKTAAKTLKAKLEALFPAETGYRCKQRLYYKERNIKSIYAVLSELGIDTKNQDNS